MTKSVENAAVAEPTNPTDSNSESVQPNSEAKVETEASSSQTTEITGNETPAEAAEKIEDAIDKGASKEDVAKLVETFKIKSFGKEKEVTIDWNDKDDIKRRLELAEAARPAMQESAEIKKLLKDEIDNFRNDPKYLFDELEMDPYEWAEKMIQNKINDLQKSPEEVEREKAEQEAIAKHQELQEREEKLKQQEFDNMVKKYETDLENEILGALDNSSVLPKSRYSIKRLSDAMLDLHKAGYENVSVKEALPIVEQEIKDEFNAFFENMPFETLEKFFGDKISEKLRHNRLSKITAPAANIPETGTLKKHPKKERNYISVKDFMKNSDAFLKGK